MDNSLISKLELWPGGLGGKAPTAYNLTVLAVVYGTMPHRLVASADRDKLPRRDQLVLRATNPQPTTSHDSTTKPTVLRAIADSTVRPPNGPRWAHASGIPEDLLCLKLPRSADANGSCPQRSTAPLRSHRQARRSMETVLAPPAGSRRSSRCGPRCATSDQQRSDRKSVV